MLERALAWIRAWGPRERGLVTELALAFGVVVLATVARLGTLEPIEIGGDALNKWQFVREWFYAFDVRQVEWNHHLSRMGVNLPLGLIQLVCGRHALVYYVAAVGASSAAALFTYVAGRLVHGPVAGVLAAVWATLFPSWIRAGAQVSPDSFGAAWGMLGLVCLLIEPRTERRARVWLVASAACMGAAYLAKEPLVFFVPGALVAVWIMKRSVRDVALYAAVPLGMFALETAFYRTVSPFSSRFALVSSTHGHKPIVVDSVLDVFGRFTALPGYWHLLLLLAGMGAALLPWLAKDRRIYAVLGPPAAFYFFYTFAFRSLHPLSLWTRFLPRYFDAVVPFTALVAVLFVVTLLERGLGRAFRAQASELERASRFSPLLAGVLLLAFLVGTLVAHPLSANHVLADTRRYESILTDAYARGIPLVTRGGDDGYRALKAAYSIYIDDTVLARDGVLPRYGRAFGSSDQIVRPGAKPAPPGCSITLRARDRFLRVEQKAKARPECG